MAAKLKGIAAAPGIAIAPLVHFHTDLDFVPTRKVREEDIPGEIRRLEDAIGTASRGILFLRHEMAAKISDRDAKIYDTHLALLHDATFKNDMVAEIEKDHVNVEVALLRVLERYQQVFEAQQDPILRERSADVRDVGRQVLGALMERERSVYIAGGKDYIFAAEEFLPSDAGLLDREHLRGIATVRGGKYSHGAILARSLGIPALVGVEGVLTKVASGKTVILDGESGVLIPEPDADRIDHYRSLMAKRLEADRRVFEVRFAPAVTSDGTEVRLMANVESVHDLDHVELDVVSGIGLFRTEFAFMERKSFPGEDEQVGMYTAAVERAGGKVVTFRTLDIGGDKPLAYFRTPEERNPVLGWRGLRICLDWPDILYTQIRALLRAAAVGPTRILLPMVTSLDEIRRCLEVAERIRSDMAEQGEPHDGAVEIGVMVEVPALVQILDHVFEHVDFVSVGTNDLVQYLLAVDRDNPRVAGQYDPYHPAVLRTLRQVATAAAVAGKPASICGEIAGDHHFTPLLIGLGFRELSMAPVFLPRVKLMVRNFSLDECEELAAGALEMDSAAAIRELAQERVRQRWSGFLSAGTGPGT